MKKLVLMVMASLSLSLLSFTGLAGVVIKDNGETEISLSNSNYNRIYIKGDEIWDFAFPPGSLAIQQDKEDHSVYIMPARTPITLFLTTKNGRHFSLTLNGEESLGKTIELIPSGAPSKTTMLGLQKNNNQNTNITQEAVPEAISAMLEHMENHKPFMDVAIKKQYGRAERWSKGLSLLPKESWEGKQLRGEVIELYNNSNKPLMLSQEWFAKEGTLAIKFSKPSLSPKQSAMLYRIQEVSHG